MPTVRRCCIVGCMSNSRQNPSLQFFQFPRPDNPFYKMWTQACQASLSRILPFKKPVVCALHFHPHCIGGRRLTGSAVPTLKLEVPSNLKAVEQQAMVEEIERSRKCAYINAVVYEWLVRANLNPQLRGSITHGMIKEKAETAKQIIGCDSFMADNRWLNRFRETHLTGFAQKLASNQLKPMGPSLWIPDIVQDLGHLFPPTSAERIDNFENMPEQYINYMKQYAEYDEEDESSEQEAPQTYTQQEPPDNGYGQETKLAAQSYYQQQQVAQSYYQHQQPQHHHQQQQHHHQPPQNGYYGHHPHPGMHPAAAYSSYHDYYGHERPPHPQQHYHHQSPHPQHHNAVYGSHHPGQPLPHPGHPQSNLTAQPLSPPQSVQHQQPPSRPPSHTPPQQNGVNNTMPSDRTSPYSPSVNGTAKRPRSAELVNDEPPAKSPRTSPVNGSAHSSPSRPASKSPTPPPPQPPTVAANGGESNNKNNNDTNIDNSFKIKLPLANGNGNSSSQGSSNNSQRSYTPNSQTNNLNSRSNSPKSQNGQTTNGNTSPTPSQSTTTNATKELETYAQAIEYLKPLEDFALFKENFRAIGLISQLENILKKANKRMKQPPPQITAE